MPRTKGGGFDIQPEISLPAPSGLPAHSRPGAAPARSRTGSRYAALVTPFRAPLSRPADFFEFWSQTMQELSRVAPAVGLEPAGGRDGIRLQRLSFTSLGGVTIHGYLLRWEDREPRPLVVHGHGYGGQVTAQWSWARAGLNVVGVDVRGWGRSRAALPSPSRWGWVLSGRESPERSVLRGAVCDYLRAAQVGRRLLGGATTRTVLEGTSLAGGLALMAEALAGVADLLAIAVPSFGWAEGRRLLASSGSAAEINRYLERRPEHAAEDLMVVLRYFDPVNFAGQVVCPTLIGVGQVDPVVPAPTVLAIADRLGGPHEVLRFPVSHSDGPEEDHWSAFERRWLELARNGVGDGFGR
jgi:cephalosporin-C deacetylase